MSSAEFKKAYGIPESYIEVDGVQGYQLTWTELLIHTGHRGKFIRKLWTNEASTYGYVELIEGGMTHGSLYIHPNHQISLS